MTVFRKNDYLRVYFDNGQEYITYNCTDELWNSIEEHLDDEESLKSILMKEVKDADYTGELVKQKVTNSSILTKRGNSIYMLSVSELSIPEDFALKILEAEEAGNQSEIEKYKNFWTLVSLNPDSRVRDNIFWFIRKWDMRISDSGFIVAYRNADIKSEASYTTKEVKKIINDYYTTKYIDNIDPNAIILPVYNKSLAALYNEIINEGKGSPIYTDHHSHSTTIILGKPVSIPREECDNNQENVCSSGLHVASKGWLKSNYFGTVGLQVLVNPAKIVAVPPRDSYGKMRCCEYFPVAIVDFDEFGDIIEKPYSLHNDIAYLKQIKYEGNINNEDVNHYELSVMYDNNEALYDSILDRLNSKQ